MQNSLKYFNPPYISRVHKLMLVGMGWIITSCSAVLMSDNLSTLIAHRIYILRTVRKINFRNSAPCATKFSKLRTVRKLNFWNCTWCATKFSKLCTVRKRNFRNCAPCANKIFEAAHQNLKVRTNLVRKINGAQIWCDFGARFSLRTKTTSIKLALEHTNNAILFYTCCICI